MIKCTTPNCKKESKPIFLQLISYSPGGESTGRFRCPDCGETFRAPVSFQGTEESVTNQLRGSYPSRGFTFPVAV